MSLTAVDARRAFKRRSPTILGVSVGVGLCGFSMAFDDYVREFPLVEVQQTFYEPPRDATMWRWRAEAPAGLEFTVKTWQLVTHPASSPTYRRLRRALSDQDRREAGFCRLTPIVLDAWNRTLECCAILHATAVLLQCPASFRPTDDSVAALRIFASTVRRPDGLRLLWEPPGPWPLDLVGELCGELDLTHVVDPFVSRTTTPDRAYFRLHGTTGARHVYTDAELEQLAAWLPDECEQPYVLFNNLPRVSDARRFRALVAERRALDPPAGR